MNKTVIFIADFFVEQIVGGGELNNEELINLLKDSDFAVTKYQSHTVGLKTLQDNLHSFFIISNFINLTQDCREFLTNNARYIIYEHDHKYLASRNPATYKNFKAPVAELRNYFFYKAAQKVVCQSHFHKEIIDKNLGTDNVVTVAGNLWALDTLDHLRTLASRPKEDRCSIMDSPIPHKNTVKAKVYCENKGLAFDLVADNDPLKFLEKLGRNRVFVFFPGTPETLSRIVVEARMMGMAIRTNDLVSASREDWFALKGEKLIDFMVAKRDEILQLFVNEIESFPTKERKAPKVSVITTFYTGEEFLEGFLDNLTNQTIFDQCELIMIDTGSPGNEKDIIEPYLNQWPQITYIRHDERYKPTVGLNLAIKESRGDFLTFAFLDDRKSLSCLETLLEEIKGENSVDLVYGNCLRTATKNETFEESGASELFSHSVPEFSRENMIKCLPGPMPLWRKTLHEKNGLFDQDGCDYADDWEMWLRAVSTGSQFKKVNKSVGLYLEGGRSQQSYNLDQRREEAQIFYRYARIFGSNFHNYKPYFDQFLN